MTKSVSKSEESEEEDEEVEDPEKLGGDAGPILQSRDQLKTYQILFNSKLFAFVKSLNILFQEKRNHKMLLTASKNSIL